MRTVFVNPGTSLAVRKKRRGGKRGRRRRVGRPRAVHAPVRRVRRRRRHYRKVPYRIVRRRNAGIAPFIQGQSNPSASMMVNPRRRRRHKNPLASMLNPKKLVSTALTLGGGSAIGTGVNILVLRSISDVYMRNGARVACAVLGSMLLPGAMGQAMAGATLYPMWAEIALLTKLVPDTTGHMVLGADLSADLNGMLDDGNSKLFD